MRRRCVASAGLLGLLAIGAVEAAPEVDLGLWGSVAAIGDGPYSVARADEIAVVAAQLTRGLVMDEKSSDLVHTLYRDLLSLHLGRLYQMLPSKKGEAHWMGLEGVPTDKGYSLTLMAQSPTRSSAKLGALAGWLEMVPIEQRFGSGTPYAIDQRLEIGTGATGPRDLALFISGLLVELERASGAEQPKWAVAAARAAEPRLKGEDLQILSALHAALPTGAAALVDVVKVRGLGSRVPCGDGVCLAYNVDLMLDTDGVRRAGFRNLAETIRRWDNLAKAQARIRLPSGADVAHLVIRTKPAGIRLRFVSQNGRIVPVRGGQVVLDEAFPLVNIDQKLEVEVRADVRYEGFALEVRDLSFPGRLVSNDSIASFSGRINQSPSLVLSGTDAVRSSLATFADNTLGLGVHGRDFARYVAEGRNGQGTPMKISLERTSPKHHVLKESTDTVLLDNSLIRFAFRVVGGRLIPNEKAIDEFGSLLEQVVGAAVKDYKHIRPQLLSRQASAP